MKRIDKTYKIITPMFIGDAKQELTSLRPPSIKGALRFWWRALNWATYFNGDIAQSLRKLHEQEGKLFGQAAREGVETGQASFLLQLSEQPKLIRENSWPQNNTGSGYLGYGLMDREGFKETTKFTLSLIFKPNTLQTDIDSIKETIEVFGLLGGLGARSRRGLGSISDPSLLSEEEYINKINALLDKYKNITDEPPYTAFSKNANFKIISSESTARNAHQQAGNLYKEYRYQFQRKERIPFGLPIQNADTKNRRSSPLFFHIHPLKNNKFIAVVLYLPAVFHPKYATDYKHISGFIN